MVSIKIGNGGFQMKIIGLTGGIGSGKSTVSEYLQKKGLTIIDADKIAREIVVPGSKVLSEIVKLFGTTILFEDGSLNRKKLGEIVFSDSQKKLALDNLMHHIVIELIQAQIKELERAGAKLVFVDAPLLFETGLDRYVNEVWVVDVDDETRIHRIMGRDSLSREEILKRIASQMGRNEKNKKADYIIDNTGTIDQLYVHIDTLLKKTI